MSMGGSIQIISWERSKGKNWVLIFFLREKVWDLIVKDTLAGKFIFRLHFLLFRTPAFDINLVLPTNRSL